MNIEQRMMEQRQRKAADAKKRTQGRQAFKAQLESNAPARKYDFFMRSLPKFVSRYMSAETVYVQLYLYGLRKMKKASLQQRH